MRKNWLKITAFAMAVTLGSFQVCAADAGMGFGNQQEGQMPGGNAWGGMPGGTTGGSYSHGSSETVTEDMLVTESAIPSDYTVNSDIQGDAEDGDYVSYFNNDSIENVYIDIDENNWNYMLQNATDKPDVLTNSVTIGGETVQYAGIKTKGNLTLSSVWNSDSDRFSFTVNFGKYIKKKTDGKTQNFHGLSKVAFNNIYGDASLMKEYLSYELMTKMGVDTPCYSLVNLYVNDELWGVYMMVESIDDSLTERTLGEKSDYLVKPESSGGDLVYDSALDEYIDENGDFNFDDIEYPTDSSNPLYKYNGLWENDEDTFDDVKDMLPTVFKWMKQLNELSNTEDANTDDYIEQLESIMDVDSILRYFAANTYLVNLDSYQSEKMQNYALYMSKEGVAHILPWDYNYSFGGYGVSNAAEMVNFSIDNPVVDVTLAERPLLNVLLQNDELKAKYEQYLSDCCIIASEGGTTSDGETYEADNFATILAKYAETLNETYGNDPTAFYTVSQYQSATENLTALIKDRTTAVLQQLDGNDEEISTNVNLSAIGNTVGGAGGNPGEGGGPGGNGQPGDNGQISDSTLTDDKTGISITGQFMPGSELSVSEMSDGTEYDTAKSLLENVGDNFKLYNIATSNSTVSGGAAQIPGGNEVSGGAAQMPGGNEVSGGAAQMPGGNEVSGGAAQIPGGNEVSGGAAQMPGGNQVSSSAISFEIKFDETQSLSGVSVYYIDTQNNKAEKMDTTVSGSSITFEYSQLGLFAIVYGDNSNNGNGTTSEYEKGDIDNSGKVDLTDALLSLKAALGIIELDDEQAAAADVNGDNSVDLTDTVMILKIALGISAE